VLQIGRRELLWGAGATLIAPAARAFLAAPAEPIVTPEQFGAVGDGRTNDTAAFRAMTAHVNRLGGGTVVLSARTYIVGEQKPDPAIGYLFGPSSIMDFEGCTRPLTIMGNGAHVRCADGLRFGTFTASGRPTHYKTPYYRPGELACPYFSMIKIEGCKAPVQINDLELDGNVNRLQIGGPWGDAGWQIACAGIRLTNNGAPIFVSRVWSHHHGQDGGTGEGNGLPGQSELVTIQDCRFSSNGRNGWSLVGGVGWTFKRCMFEKSARSLAFPGSPPASGIDFEAEGGKHVDEIRLIECAAEDNASAGCVHAASARTSAVSWIGGRIVGTTSWSYFGGGNRGMSFKDTLFLGALVSLTTEAFTGCTFSDEAKHSPTGQLYNPTRFIIPDARRGNIFDRCTIIHSTPGVSANGSVDQALFENCAFYSVAGAGRLDVYGHFRGRDTRFIAKPGGTNFQVTPDGRGGTKSAGRAEDSFSITRTDGVTVVYPAR
jgi:hypothetical protein